MWGHYSYLVSTIIFTGSPVFLEFIFGYHLLKPHFKQIGKTFLFFIVGFPLIEAVAIGTRAWDFNPEKHLGVILIKSPAEILVVCTFISLAVSFAIITWTFYEDQGKPVISTSFYDAIHGTYAIWKKLPSKSK